MAESKLRVKSVKASATVEYKEPPSVKIDKANRIIIDLNIDHVEATTISLPILVRLRCGGRVFEASHQVQIPMVFHKDG